MKGRHGYGPDIRLKAKALWIVGRLTDEQIAAQVGVQRPETIGEWRRAGQWDIERDIIQQETERRISAAVAETISEMNSRHLKEFQLMQTKAVQALRSLEPAKASEAAAMLDAGILDATHLRFFTLKGIQSLVAGAGLRSVDLSIVLTPGTDVQRVGDVLDVLALAEQLRTGRADLVHERARIAEGEHHGRRPVLQHIRQQGWRLPQ